MLPQYYKISHGIFLNNLLQVWLIGNKRYQVPPFRYIDWDIAASPLVRGVKVLGNMKYLMRSFNLAAEGLVFWTEENWDVKRVNSLFTMVYLNCSFKLVRKPVVT